MCYSAKVMADFRWYEKHYGAGLDIDMFVRLLERWRGGEKITLPKGMTDAFKLAEPRNDGEERCKTLVLEYEAVEMNRLQEQLFAQRRRLADAERSLEVKATKKASEEVRIANNKIKQLFGWITDLDRTKHLERDDRIYPSDFAPVLTMDEGGKLVIRPMRYLCRPKGVPAFFDKKYPGTYNAKRTSFTGYWKSVYAKTHAIIVATTFFEHVKRHRLEGRALAPGEKEEDVVIRFDPSHGRPMELACLWSHWTGASEPDLNSFAIVTDEPPPEVAAAGHDRCPIPLKHENVEDWLRAPAPTDYQALLDDKERPYYEHQLAA